MEGTLAEIEKLLSAGHTPAELVRKGFAKSSVYFVSKRLRRHRPGVERRPDGLEGPQRLETADLSELLREAFQELKSQELTFWIHMTTHHGLEPEDKEVESLVALGKRSLFLAEKRLANISEAYAQRRLRATRQRSASHREIGSKLTR